MDYDVIIAGAGPVGLFLACELRLAKLSVLVLETAENRCSPLKRLPFGLRGLWGPSIDAFYRRGLLEQIASHRPGAAATGLPKPSSIAVEPEQRGPGGHFAGIQFDVKNIDASRWSYRVAGPADTLLAVEMEHIEGVLTARAQALGVEIRQGHGVDRFGASNDDVIVYSGERRFTAGWLVGCDGGRSTVRKLGGFEFVGTDAEFTGYAVQAELADPSVLPLGRVATATGTYTQWQPGVLSLVDFDGGAFHRVHPMTAEHVQSVLRRVSGTDVTVTSVSLVSTWTDRSYQATTYRKGRVLLAGDAAHIHSPLGGQGLNLGLGDAMNLGWKLASTVRGDAPEGLLDSYSAERHPIGAKILEWTRAQVALMRPDPRTRALHAVFRDLLETRDGATYVADQVWGVSLRHDLGGEHPLIGRSCPDFELTDGARVGELLREGTGLVLDFGGTLIALDGYWGHRVKYSAKDATHRLGLSALVVRPDGIVAWVSEGMPDVEAARAAGIRWFGADRSDPTTG